MSRRDHDCLRIDLHKQCVFTDEASLLQLEKLKAAGPRDSKLSLWHGVLRLPSLAAVIRLFPTSSAISHQPPAPVNVQLVASVKDEGDLCTGREVQGEGAVQAAAAKASQLAPRAGAGYYELGRLQAVTCLCKGFSLQGPRNPQRQRRSSHPALALAKSICRLQFCGTWTSRRKPSCRLM